MENYLIHYGQKERSGRYPYGSGDDPFQRIKRSGFSKNQKKKIIKKAQQEVREKSVSEMTDKEIEKRLARLKLESNYEQEKRKRESYNTKDDSREQKPVTSGKPSYYGKSISDMSDEELNSFLNRLRLEDQVKQYTQPKMEKRQESGKEWLSNTMKTAGKEAVKDFISKSAKYGTNKLYDYITGKDKQRIERKTPSWAGKKISQMTDSELNSYIKRHENEATARKLRGTPSYFGKQIWQMTDSELKAYNARLALEENVRKKIRGK